MKPEDRSGAQVARAHQRLLDLAEDASLYLRRHGEPSVRVAAALLIAASLAACAPSAPSVSEEAAPAVPPLTEEVRQGLPTAAGTYPLASNSVTRDAQGVYGFTWRDPTGPATWHQAQASLLRLAQGTDDALEVPPSGDPILRLKPDTPITLPDDDGATPGPTPTPGGSSSSTTRSSTSGTSGSRSILWYPFPSSTTQASTTTAGQAGDSVAATTPAYRNPPAAEPGQGSVRGSSASMTAPSTSARTWTSPSRAAATGQAGGPGRGTAVSSRSGSLSGPASGAARPSSSGFSGGKSGASSGSSVG